MEVIFTFFPAERIDIFLPSVLIISCIALITFLYIRIVRKCLGVNLKSVEWNKENLWKSALMIGTPILNLGAPAVEELIFRAPLIIIFDSISSTAWYGILISSLLFGLAHFFGKKVSMSDLFSARENNENESDDVQAETDRIHKKLGKIILARRIFHVFVTFLAGIVFGYYGIVYQSIWVSFGLHSLWNLIMPFIMPVLIFLGSLVFAIFYFLFQKMRDSILPFFKSI